MHPTRHKNSPLQTNVTDTSDSDNKATEQPLLSHIIELRSRLIKALSAILLVFLALFYFANDIYRLIAAPLMRHLPDSSHMIATEVASPFLVPFKLTLCTAIFIAMPYLLMQIWGFIAPGLYVREQKLMRPLLISSTLLFYAGAAFAYFIVFPLIFAFFNAAVPQGVLVMTDIGHYLDFVLKLFFAFGLAFEVPVATVLLIWSDFTSIEKLRQGRAYIIVTAFVIGMLLTPPDIISQILLALPIWLLFEAGLYYAAHFPPPRKTDD